MPALGSMKRVLLFSSITKEVPVIGETLGVELGGIGVGIEACLVCCADTCAVPAACVARMLGLMVGVVGIFRPGNAHAVIAIRMTITLKPRKKLFRFIGSSK